MLSLGHVWSGGGETTLGGVIQYRSAGNDPEKDGLPKQANLFRFPPQTFAFPMLQSKVNREPAALAQRDRGCMLKGQLCASVISCIEWAQSLQKGPQSAQVTLPLLQSLTQQEEMTLRGGGWRWMGGELGVFLDLPMHCPALRFGEVCSDFSDVLAQLRRGRVTKQRGYEDPDGREQQPQPHSHHRDAAARLIRT